jgi:hypothetical protein
VDAHRCPSEPKASARGISNVQPVRRFRLSTRAKLFGYAVWLTILEEWQAWLEPIRPNSIWAFLYKMNKSKLPLPALQEHGLRKSDMLITAESPQGIYLASHYNAEDGW